MDRRKRAVRPGRRDAACAGGGAQAAFVLEAFTPYRIVNLGRAMSQALGAAYADEGVTIPEWRVLAVIGAARGAPGMAARDVAARTPMDKMAVSRAVASLEAKGLVRRSHEAADRRVAHLSLTQAGRSVHGRIARLALAYEQALLSGLGEQDRERFLPLLSKLEASFGDGR